MQSFRIVLVWKLSKYISKENKQLMIGIKTCNNIVLAWCCEFIRVFIKLLLLHNKYMYIYYK